MSVTANRVTLPPEDAYVEEWLKWFLDCLTATLAITQHDLARGREEDLEIASVKMALYARAITLLDDGIILLKNRRLLAFRIHARPMVETAIYLIALDHDPALLQRMKADDDRSRAERASLHLKSSGLDLPPDVAAIFAKFISEKAPRAGRVELAKLLNRDGFDRLYRTFRDISADAAHSTITALLRHADQSSPTKTTLVVSPPLGDLEFKMTAMEVALVMLLSTLAIMPMMEISENWAPFQQLARRYHELSLLGPRA